MIDTAAETAYLTLVVFTTIGIIISQRLIVLPNDLRQTEDIAFELASFLAATVLVVWGVVALPWRTLWIVIFSAGAMAWPVVGCVRVNRRTILRINMGIVAATSCLCAFAAFRDISMSLNPGAVADSVTQVGRGAPHILGLYPLGMVVFLLMRFRIGGARHEMPKFLGQTGSAMPVDPECSLARERPRHNFELGHWVLVASGRYAGRRAMIVGRNGSYLRLLVNRGPCNAIRLNMANVRLEMSGSKSIG